MNAIVKVNSTNALAKVGAGSIGAQRKRAALATVIENIRSDTEQFVPMSGQNIHDNLRMSVDTSKGEDGYISWKKHYANIVYHMPQSTHWTTAGTGAQWVERAYAIHKQRWQSIVVRCLNG